MDNGSNGTGRTRVAIACQGGGSHTAFTAGVLQWLTDRVPRDVELVALSGTSGGAICAALAWDGLVRGQPTRARQRLQDFWDAMAANDPWDRLTNQMLMTVMTMRDLMVMPEISPYQVPTFAADRFREILNRLFDFEELRQLAGRPGAPGLHIGAVEVLSGHFELFTGEDLCAECLLASAAIPELFRAVQVPNRGMFWDGLFSQNPPIHDLVDFDIDEVWVVQINPSSCPRLPTSTHDILDRRNELAGNLSLEQEIGFMHSINRLIAEGTIDARKYKHIDIHRIALDQDLDYRSKLDRRPGFLEELREYGSTRARWFLAEREARLPRVSPAQVSLS